MNKQILVEALIKVIDKTFDTYCNLDIYNIEVYGDNYLSKVLGLSKEAKELVLSNKDLSTTFSDGDDFFFYNKIDNYKETSSIEENLALGIINGLNDLRNAYMKMDRYPKLFTVEVLKQFGLNDELVKMVLELNF